MANEKWQSEIERAIQDMLEEAQQQGFSGQGKPLRLDDDQYVPDDQRMAYKIMKDNDIPPEWITQGKALERKREKFFDALYQAVRIYQDDLQHAVDANARDKAKARWARKRASLAEQCANYNDEVLSYNLKVPDGIPHRRTLNFERELEKALNA